MSNDPRSINQVRQVLMNEMGFTKESVREEMKRLVAEEAKKTLNAIVCQGYLESLVREQFQGMLKQSRWTGTTIYDVVRSEAAKQAKFYFEQRLSISLDGNPIPSEKLAAEQGK